MSKTRLLNKRFGRLVVVSFNGLDWRGKARWDCRCDCGNEKVVSASNLENHSTRSCGCIALELISARNLSHGHTSGGRVSNEYIAYRGAKVRCSNPNYPESRYYMGRGIEFRFKNFEEFFAELGHRPSPKHSLDRIDNNGHYEKGNVRWATQSEQSRNRRKQLLCKRGHSIVAGDPNCYVSATGGHHCRTCRKIRRSPNAQVSQ